MKKLIFRGPVQTASGYGVYARSILKALDESGKFDITVMSVPWGATPLIYEKTPEIKRIEELAKKFNPSAPGNYDISVQVTIPVEFMKLAEKNVCVTAGIEVDKVAPAWQQKCNEVADIVVVPSVHSARAFTEAIYNAPDGKQLLLKKPLYILPIEYDKSIFNTTPLNVEKFSFPSKFNFLAMGLGLDREEGHDRKNFHQLIRWFCEQFKDNQDVGLVLKLSMVNYSVLDYMNVQSRIRAIKARAGCGQFPRIHLIHGRLGDEDLAALYKSKSIHALVTLTHGEGYGLPILEAAACGLPVVATDWSGHLDFLEKDGKKLFIPVNYELKEISQESIWQNVYEPATKWAWPIEADTKMKMGKIVLSYDKPKQWAMELAEHISNTFTSKTLSARFIEDIYDIACDIKKPCSKNLLVKTSSTTRVLDNVTLVAVSTGNRDEIINVVEKSRSQINFGKTLIVLSNEYESLPLPDSVSDCQVMFIPKFNSVAECDEFVMKKLPNLITTEFFMTIHPDGFILNGSAWSDDFLKYDYIGAPWFWNDVVGNGGFCIRSMKLARELQKEDYASHPMDMNICVEYRKKLEDAGFIFSPSNIARKFSVENGPYTGQFGWHGKNPFYGQI